MSYQFEFDRLDRMWRALVEMGMELWVMGYELGHGCGCVCAPNWGVVPTPTLTPHPCSHTNS
jgi:hypothetical protein